MKSNMALIRFVRMTGLLSHSSLIPTDFTDGEVWYASTSSKTTTSPTLRLQLALAN